MARVASQIFSSRKTTFLRFVRPYVNFSYTVESNKTRIESLRRSVKFQPVNSDLTPIRVFLDDVRTKTTPA